MHGTSRLYISARWRVAIAFAALTSIYAAARAIHEPTWPTDFDQLWFAARALLHGTDPYSVVGPGRAFQWDWPLYYPLPAVLITVPFTVLPVAVARVVFSGISAGVLGWAIGERVRYLWPLLLSAAYLIATSRTQWAPLLLAAAWLPWLSPVVTAKPNIGLASLAALRGRGVLVAVAGIVAMTLLSLVIYPTWIASWRAATANAPHIVAPILLPGGFLLALAVLRWRRAEARLLLALACVPHTPSLYDLVVLFFACRTLRESIVLALLTHLLFWGFLFWGIGPTFDIYALNLGRVSIFVVFLPVLLLILSRPNVYDPPANAGSVNTSGWRAGLPQSRIDLVLAGGLLIGAAFLIWLPLVTTRLTSPLP